MKSRWSVWLRAGMFVCVVAVCVCVWRVLDICEGVGLACLCVHINIFVILFVYPRACVDMCGYVLVFV